MKQKIFKSLFMKAAIMAICTTVYSCDDTTVEVLNPSTLDVDKHYLSFELGDGPKDVEVYYQDDWNYSVNEHWVHVNRNGYGNKLTVQVEDNRTKETRACLLTIFASNNSDRKANVKITQSTSLVTVSCSETELNFSANEGASNSLSIKSNGEWKVRSTPDWLRPSVSSGIGNKTISFKTLSANKKSGNRNGTIVIGTSDEEVNIPVIQYGEAVSNCQVTPKNITVLSNGIAFDMDYSHASNVAHYYRGYMEASRVGSLTNPEIISILQNNFQRHLPSDDEVADFSDLKANTSYIIYTLAYDIEGKRGDLLSTEVRTCREETNEPCGWISDLGVNGHYWEWVITKSATCFSYWMMTTENYNIALASDVLQAWWLDEAIRSNKATEYYNGGNWQQVRGGNLIAVWTRGKTVNGTMAGKITWLGCELSSSAPTRSSSENTTSPLSMTKRNSAGDHSGRKLSPDQYQLYMIK